MKKKFIFATTIVMIFLLSSICFAANPKVQIDGAIIDFTDDAGNIVEAQLINNRTMVPLRKIFEVLNCTIEWNQETKTVTATKGNATIKLTIGDKRAYATDYLGLNEKEIILDSEPVIVDNRTLVPLRFIGESLGCDVGWDQKNQTAIIISYNEIAKIINSKSSFLYNNAINASSISVEKYYYDDRDASFNYNTKMQLSLVPSPEESGRVVNVTFSGKSDMVNEITNEGWNDFEYIVNGNHFKSSNYVFSSMFGSKKNEQFMVDFYPYRLTEDYAYSIQNWVKRVTELDTSSVDINTYSKIKTDWNRFANTFLAGSKQLKTSDFEYTYVHMENIASTRVSSDAINGLLLLNRACFRYELNHQDLLFDYPVITYEFNAISDSKVSIKITMKSEYKERIIYNIELSKTF